MSELADVYNVCMIFVHSRTCQISDKNLPTHPDRTSYEVNLQTLDFIMKVSLHYVNVYGVPHIAGRILGRLVRLGYVEKLRSCGARSAAFRFLPRSRVKSLQDGVNHYRELKQ